MHGYEAMMLDNNELVKEARRLLDSLGDGHMSATAYDTAWLARVPNPTDPEEPLFPATIQWLLRNQHADGSWGAELAFPHDRVISTLAAIVALGTHTWARPAEAAVRRGVAYLYVERPDLRSDPIDTVGFELLLPELVRQAQALDLRLPYEDWAHVEAVRADKLSRIPPVAIYGGPTTLTTSLEHQGERLIPLLAERCRAPNGSFGGSPSATAYVLTRYWDPGAEEYLRRVASLTTDGGVVFLYPFEVFETAWVLYYLRDIPLEADRVRPHLERLLAGWTPSGSSWSREGMVTDSDDTSVVIQVLGDYGYQMDTSVFGLYEDTDHFYCFPFERDASVGANAHILEALVRLSEDPHSDPLIGKLVSYLEATRLEGCYWLDKWHASPLYGADQCVRALAPLVPRRLRPTMEWLAETQHPDGSWGFGEGNAEETALALGSLLTMAEFGRSLSPPARLSAERGAACLADRIDEGLVPALWRGKALYRPDNIVRATILSALYRWANTLGRNGS